MKAERHGNSLKISERDFSTQVEDLLKTFGWKYCHFRAARTEHGWRTALSGHQGFPDIVAVRPPRLLFLELKSEKGKLTPEQELWLEALRECRITATTAPLKVKGRIGTVDLSKRVPVLTIPECYLFRPSDLEMIVEMLR